VPNLTGCLRSGYDDFQQARLAHGKFQEMVRRGAFQLKVELKAGDMYLWRRFSIAKWEGEGDRGTEDGGWTDGAGAGYWRLVEGAVG